MGGLENSQVLTSKRHHIIVIGNFETSETLLSSVLGFDQFIFFILFIYSVHQPAMA